MAPNPPRLTPAAAHATQFVRPGQRKVTPCRSGHPGLCHSPLCPPQVPALPRSPLHAAPFLSQPLCSVYLCLLSPPDSAERHLGRRWRSWSLILGDSSPSSQIPVVCTLTFCPWSSVPRFMAWCSSVSGFNTHRQDSEKPRGLDLFSNVPFPQLRIKATRRVGNQELFLVRS